MIRNWLGAVGIGLVSLLMYVIVWQVWLWSVTPRRVAIGMGVIRQFGPDFIVTGLLFVAFGILLMTR